MKHLPVVILVSSVIIFWYAGTLYPGGTRLDPTTTGYSWAENTITALIRPYALNGEVNPARWIAVFAIFLFTGAGALLFHSIASFMSGINQQLLRSTIGASSGAFSGALPGAGTTNIPGKRSVSAVRIGGIGAMVSAFLVVTPLHDVKVTLALIFFTVALVALFRWLRAVGMTVLLLAGLAAFSLPLFNAVLFYGQIGHEWLPLVQKSGKFACIFWLIGCYYVLGGMLQKLRQ